MQSFLRSALAVLAVPIFLAGCGSLSLAEKLDEKRIELYALEDAVRNLNPEVADVLLAALVTLEAIADEIDEDDPSD